MPGLLFWTAYFCGVIVSSIKVRDFGLVPGTIIVSVVTIVLAAVFFFLLDRYWTRKS